MGIEEDYEHVLYSYFTTFYNYFRNCICILKMEFRKNIIRIWRYFPFLIYFLYEKNMYYRHSSGLSLLSFPYECIFEISYWKTITMSHTDFWKWKFWICSTFFLVTLFSRTLWKIRYFSNSWTIDELWDETWIGFLVLISLSKTNWKILDPFLISFFKIISSLYSICFFYFRK